MACKKDALIVKIIAQKSMGKQEEYSVIYIDVHNEYTHGLDVCLSKEFEEKYKIVEYIKMDFIIF